MPRLTPADARLILDHVLGDPSVPAAAVDALLATLPFPSDPTPRLRRGVLLRRLAADPVSQTSLDVLQLLASHPVPASPIAAAHIAVAAFLAASAADFDAAARALFARPDGRAVGEGGPFPALASDGVIDTMEQFEAAVGNPCSQAVLRGLWGDRSAAEERVRELLAAEWAAMGPSLLEAAAEQIVGDGAVETWRAADEATRLKLRILAGEERTCEIMGKLEEPTSTANPVSTPAVGNVARTYTITSLLSENSTMVGFENATLEECCGKLEVQLGERKKQTEKENISKLISKAAYYHLKLVEGCTTMEDSSGSNFNKDEAERMFGSEAERLKTQHDYELLLKECWDRRQNG